MLYTLDKLREEAFESLNQITPLILESSEEVENVLNQFTKKLNLKYPKILSTGSTNKKRLTAIIDPTNKDIFPIDFDLRLVYDNDETDKIKEFEAILPFQTTLKRSYGRSTINFNDGNFNYEITLINSNDSCDAITYSQNVEIEDEKKRIEIAAFKLLTMRAGVYGSFNKGLKGIGIEQLILNNNSIENSLNLFRKGFSELGNLGVLHPNGKNLLVTISLEMYNRINQLRQEVDQGQITNNYFSGFGENTFIFEQKGNKPIDAYKRAIKFANRASKNGMKLKNLTIIPTTNSNLTYMEFLDVNDLDLNNLRRRFN